MNDQDTPTPRQLQEALEKTVPAADFSAAGTQRELDLTSPGAAPEPASGQILGKTIPDPQAAPSNQDSTMLPGFNTTSLVPLELMEPGSATGKRFEMDGLLGKGGNATVYAVRDHSLGRRIALKLLQGRSAALPGVQQRFVHEARVTAMLEHPNIVPVYDIGVTEQGRVYFLMKSVTGVTVGDAIRAVAGGAEAPAEFRTIDGRIRILLKVCDAMAFAHDKGYVHQDLKPDNIMLGGFGEVQVMDWGCALNADERAKEPRATYGTPAYMSPEQARQEGADERSDIYCLGATLYQMIALRHPTRDGNPERFWELKRAGALTPLPPELETSLPGALLAIARTAMAPRAAERYQSVARMRAALVDYQAHAESIALAQRALAQLTAAGATRDYAVFAAIAARLEQALEMWPENDDARAGLHSLKRAHALCAIEKGDLALAESMLAGIPECADILAVLASERTRRASQLRRGRLTLYGAAILAMALLGLFGYYVIDYFRYFGKWQLLYRQDFTQPKPDLNSLAFSAFSLTTDESPDSSGPGGILLNGSHMFWLRNARTSGDVRLEVEVRWPERVDGLELMINARREQGTSFAFCPTGYSCQFGGWMGTVNSISRNDRPQSPGQNSNAVEADFKPGRTYRLWFQKEGEDLSLFVDGRKVFGTVEPVPIAGAGLDWCGIRAWIPTEIRSVSVWRKGSPAKASPLIAGNAFVESGLFALAAQRYLAVAQDHPGTRIEEQALTRAYLVSDSVENPDSIRTAIRAALGRSHPRSVYRPLLLESDCRRAWSAGQTERALQLAGQALDDNPDSRIALHLLAERPAQLTTTSAQRVLELVGRTTRVASLGLQRLGLTDLSPIAHMRLRSLDCSENDIASLEPLRGMPLRRLSAFRNLVTSIEPLTGMPLEDLILSDNLISDLTPLKGMPLSRLQVRINPLSSIEPLRGLPLVDLNIEATGVESLEPLRGMPLQTLICKFNRISNLTPLKGMPLRTLFFAGNRVSSLEHLAGLPLTILELNSNDVSDIGPLAGMKLDNLNLSLCPVADLSVLNGMPLTGLNVSGTRVSSLEPLRGMPLHSISIEGCPVADLSPLRGMPLRSVTIDGSAVRDLEPLRGMSLDLLSCWNVPITSPGPFTRQAPPVFRFNLSSERWPAAMAAVAAWRSNGDTVNAHRALIARAFAAGDTRALIALGTAFQGRRYVHVPWRVSHHAADSIAARFGGHLVTLTSRSEQIFVLSLLANDDGAWLGLRSDSTGDFWCTGEKFEFSDFDLRDQAQRRQPAYLLRHYAIWRYWFRRWLNGEIAGFVIEWEQS